MSCFGKTELFSAFSVARPLSLCYTDIILFISFLGEDYYTLFVPRFQLFFSCICTVSPPYNRCSRHKTRGCAYVIPRISILISDFLKICRSMFAYWTDKVIRKHFSFINISTNLTSPPRFFLRHWSIFDIGLIVGVCG